MKVHLDTGDDRPRCHTWRPKPAWPKTMFLQDVTCKRCLKHAGKPQSGQPKRIIPRPVYTPESDEDREAWLKWRQGGLGGSDMAAILGLSAWSTPFDVWLSKTKGLDIGDSRAMWIGRKLEQAVGEAAADHFGLDLIKTGPRVSDRSPIVRGTADFMLPDDSGLECKTTRNSWDAIPTHYEVQARWYMEVYDVDVWRLACLHRGQDFTFWTLHRDRAIGERMVERALAWWAKHIEEGERPPLEGRNAGAYLTAEHRADTGMFIQERMDSEAAARFARWSAAGEVIRKLEKQRDEDAIWLKQHIGDAKGIQGDGWRLTWSRYERKKTDFQSLKADPAKALALEELTAPYTSITPTGQLRARIEDPS